MHCKANLQPGPLYTVHILCFRNSLCLFQQLPRTWVTGGLADNLALQNAHMSSKTQLSALRWLNKENIQYLNHRFDHSYDDQLISVITVHDEKVILLLLFLFSAGPALMTWSKWGTCTKHICLIGTSPDFFFFKSSFSWIMRLINLAFDKPWYKNVLLFFLLVHIAVLYVCTLCGTWKTTGNR